MLKLKQISSLHLSIQTLKQQHSSSECPCTTIQSFSDQGIATAHPDICTASPRNPTEAGTAYDLHNGPESLPCSKLSLITLRARRTFLWGLVGVLWDPAHKKHLDTTSTLTHTCLLVYHPMDQYTQLYYVDMASAKLPNTQIHDVPYTLQTSSNPFKLQPREHRTACLCFPL